mgnify:CR=1 FL=1
MDASKEDTYELRWMVRALPISVLVLSVYVFSTAPRNNPSLGTWLLVSLFLVFLICTSLHFLMYKIYISDDGILVRRLFLDKKVCFSEIHVLDFSNPIHLLNIHRNSESWPALTISGGIENKQDLAAKIVARAPDNGDH